MKKILLASLLSFSLLTQTIVPVFAEVEITIPSGQENILYELQLEEINSFLEEFQIVKNCLKRPGQENREIALSQAICMILQVFGEKNISQTQAWESAKKLRLISQVQEKSSKLSGFEYLDLLFRAGGINVSPASETNYRSLFRKLRVRFTPGESKTLAIALEKGLIPEPASQQEAQDLKKLLSGKSIKIGEALAFLYQVATSQHEQIPINIQAYTPSTTPVPLENILKEVFYMIRTQSYFNSKFNEKKAMEAAIKAAVKSLEEDKYIEYYTSEEFRSFSESLNGNLEGIGAYIEEQGGDIIIVSPIEGSPAAKAGLLPGDIILFINDESTEEMILQQAVDKIRGPQGTSVRLKIKRESSELEFTITRNKITVPALSVSNQDNIEIIKLVQFGSNSSQEMKKELESILKKNPQGVIIDLRNNPGGFLNEVVTIVDYFLEKNKPAVYIKDLQTMNPMWSNIDPIYKDIPLAVLINKGSASASEILAGVLQAYGLAKVYGETSFGKGTVQNIVSLQSGDGAEISAFKFTTAEYLIPNPTGKPTSIDGVGVKPDSNPGGVEALVDDRDTPSVDEALNAVINEMKGEKRRR